MTATLDLTAPSITIKFDAGKTLKVIFYYLSPDKSVIDLTGFAARMQARLDYDSRTSLWDLTTENGGLSVVTGTAELDDEGVTVVNAQGIMLLVSATQTALVDWDRAVFDIELIEPGGDVLQFLKGTLLPLPEVTR